MTYTKTKNINNRIRAHNIIWLKPPSSQNVKNNIGKPCLGLLKKHFPVDHNLYIIFNRNTLQLSYSCMSSMSSIIKQHNYKVLSTTENLDYVIAEIKKTVLLMINVYKHISFARLMS